MTKNILQFMTNSHLERRRDSTRLELSLIGVLSINWPFHFRVRIWQQACNLY